MKYLTYLKIFALSLFALSSCSVDEEIDTLEITQTAWKAWLENNYTTLTPTEAVKELTPIGDEGLYYSEISAGTGTETLVYDQWVKVKYSGYNMKGGLFVTRYEGIAEDENTWLTQTNYEAQYVKIVDPDDDDYSTDVPEGLSEAFAAMTVGQKIRAYVPYYLGWGSSGMTFGYGYGGSFNLMSYENFYMDIELLDIIDDIEAYELNKVETYAVANDFKELSVGDGALWWKELGAATAPTASDEYSYIGDSDADYIIDDSSIIQVFYELWTLGDDDSPAMLVDTNIKETAIAEWGFYDHVGFGVPFTTVVASDNDFVDGIAEIIEGGSGSVWYEAVFTSDWGYGEDGLVPENDEVTYSLVAGSSNDDDFVDSYWYDTVVTAMVQAYQPLRAKFLAKVYIEEDDE